MALLLKNVSLNLAIRKLEEKLLLLTLSSNTVQIREKHVKPRPRLRNPVWLTKKNRVVHDDFVTHENVEFIKEVVGDKYKESPLNKQIITNSQLWTPASCRTGVIARKVGIYPMWLKDGKKISTTLLQVLDNHVIRTYAAGEYEPGRQLTRPVLSKKPCILIGAEAGDPTLFTKDYCGIFKDSGVIPKKHLARFFVSPDAVLPPGTPLNVSHYQVGNYVDVRGKTIDRGFQGVMKRHGFSGMPASHGHTKTHRRGGNIGGGGEKGRVWPGTKMPGHMGNRYRVARGLKIWRINTKYNILYVSGQAIPGETNSIVTIYDTLLPLRKPKEALPYPTYLEDELPPEDIYDDNIHKFNDSTIEYHEK